MMGGAVADIGAFTPKALALPGALDKLARQFLYRCRVRNLSAHTLAAYQSDLQQFVGYMQQRGCTHVQLVSSDMVSDWLGALIDGEDNSPRTAARKLETARALMRLAVEKNLITAPTAAQRVDAPKFDPAVPIAPELAHLKTCIRNMPGDTPGELRDRALAWLMLSTALRVGGLCSLDVYNPARPPRWCILPNGLVVYHYKGGKTKDTVADDQALAYVAEWLAVRHTMVRAHTDGALFITNRGNRMNRATAGNIIRKLGVAAGMPGLHCHLLRHSRAADLMGRAGLEAANYMLGQKHKSTTADMYGHVADTKRRELVQALAPMDTEAAVLCG